MTTRATMERQGRQRGERPRARYHLYFDDELDEFLCDLARRHWNGHTDIAPIIRQIIRIFREEHGA